VEGAEQVTIVVRRLRTAAGWPGKASHDFRPSGFLPLLDQEHGFNRCSILDSLERSGGSRCYPILEAPEGSVDCVHQFRRPLLSSLERPSLQAPLRSRHPTLRHRRLTRTRRDRSRYPDQMSHRWLTTRRRAATPRSDQGRFRFRCAHSRLTLGSGRLTTKHVACEPRPCRPFASSSRPASCSKSRPNASNSSARRGPAAPPASRKHRSACESRYFASDILTPPSSSLAHWIAKRAGTGSSATLAQSGEAGSSDRRY
jgi:hypothetical protein